MIIRLNGHPITAEHLDKIYFPADKITKGELLEYYKKIAPRLIPYTKNRPLTMDRYPEGITGESFYQKNASSYFPAWIKLKKIAKKEGGSNNYVVCQNAATLVYIANQGCITPHMWLSKITKLNYPDVLVFDLDPYGEKVTNFKPIRDAALMLKEILEKCGLTVFVMTTGSRGLHVRVPLKPVHTFDEVRAFAKQVGQMLVNRDSKMTLESRKEKRKNKLLIDIMRNGFAATAVVPYAVRAHPHAPVAVPLHWQELNDARLRSDTYTIKTVFKRLDKVGDVWKNFSKSAKTLTKAKAVFKKYYQEKL